MHAPLLINIFNVTVDTVFTLLYGLNMPRYFLICVLYLMFYMRKLFCTMTVYATVCLM